MDKKDPPEIRSYEKLLNQMVPKKYKFVENIQIVNYDGVKDPEEVYVELYVIIDADYVKKCTGEDEDEDEGNWESMSESEFFDECVDNTDLKKGFLSYLVSLAKYIFPTKFILIAAVGTKWSSDGIQYDDFGNRL